MIKLTSLLTEQQGIKELYYRLTVEAKSQLIADVHKLNSGNTKLLHRGFNHTRRNVAAIFEPRKVEHTRGINTSPGSNRILELLKIDRPVFCSWEYRSVFGSDNIVVPIGSFKAFQSTLVLDISAYGQKAIYKTTEAPGGMSRQSNGEYTPEQMEQRAQDGAKSFEVDVDRLDYLQRGGTAHEVILDCTQTNSYWLINIAEWADSLKTTVAKVTSQLTDYNSLVELLTKTPTKG